MAGAEPRLARPLAAGGRRAHACSGASVSNPSCSVRHRRARRRAVGGARSTRSRRDFAIRPSCRGPAGGFGRRLRQPGDTARTACGDRYRSGPLRGDRERPAAPRRDYMQREAPDGPYFLYVGSLDPRKNVETLVGAFADDAARPQERLYIVGPIEGRPPAAPQAPRRARGCRPCPPPRVRRSGSAHSVVPARVGARPPECLRRLRSPRARGDEGCDARRRERHCSTSRGRGRRGAVRLSPVRLRVLAGGAPPRLRGCDLAGRAHSAGSRRRAAVRVGRGRTSILESPAPSSPGLASFCVSRWCGRSRERASTRRLSWTSPSRPRSAVSESRRVRETGSGDFATTGRLRGQLPHHRPRRSGGHAGRIRGVRPRSR